MIRFLLFFVFLGLSHFAQNKNTRKKWIRKCFLSLKIYYSWIFEVEFLTNFGFDVYFVLREMRQPLLFLLAGNVCLKLSSRALPVWWLFCLDAESSSHPPTLI